MTLLDLATFHNIVLLTGAGISVASGLPTFRGANGMADEEFLRVSDARHLPATLPALWRLYGGLRPLAACAEPNAAHRAIADLQHRRGSAVTLLTQNVDGLHQKAGSPQVVQLHGSLFRTRCTNSDCDLAPFEDLSAPETVPLCPRCHSGLRPDLVLFGEMLPVDAEWQVRKALRDCDLFVAVGTSGSVAPASNFARRAFDAGAHTLLINLEPMTPRNPYFKQELLSRAEEILPELFELN